MSRRNQSTRRRSYGRRQHEVRERRGRSLDEQGAWLHELSDGYFADAAGGQDYDSDAQRGGRAAA